MAKRGETREKILAAGTRVFFEHGFEAASVKMILEESGVVTGSFYHFFPSKEKLFEEVVKLFLEEYSLRLNSILMNEALSVEQVIECFLTDLLSSMKTYYEVLQGDKLHWTVQCSLNAVTLDSMVEPLAKYFEREQQKGTITKLLDVDDNTLSRIIIMGSEAIILSCGKDVEKDELKYKLLEFWNKLIKF